jgi:hypothetical protein
MSSSGHVRQSLLSAIISVLMTTSIVGSSPASAAHEAAPPFIPAQADWLTTVNYFRSMAALAPVTEDPNLSDGAAKHSCYMLYNDITHDENPDASGYTPEGDAAGNNSNVAVSTGFGASARSHIELWMTGPFHAVGVLRPNLRTVGFGKCDLQGTPKWHSGATLDVIHGLGASTEQSKPILFPGDETTTNLDRFIIETPDPLPFCGWAAPAGLPVLALMPEPVTDPVTASMSGPSGMIETCALSGLNTSGVAKQLLDGNNVVVAIPRTRLSPGSYTVTITVPSRTVTWSFTVDPGAADGTTPAPVAAPSSPAVAFTGITPTRLVDSRENLGTTRFSAGDSHRIQITGRAGVAVGATAISANFTVTNTDGPGFLTAWNCSSQRPVVATVNYAADDTIPNGATVPIDTAGGICVYSLAAADLVVDVNGYFSTSGTDRFTPLAPVRLMDTRLAIGAVGRLSGGDTASLQVGGVAGVSTEATAVTLNVASVDPGAAGFVTVFPCDQPRPLTASINPQPGKVSPNLVLSPLADNGSVCFYTLHDVDLVVDITGFLSVASTANFTATIPFRFTDTRDKFRPELNAGTIGMALAAGQTLSIQIAGQRGVPATTRAVSVNIAAANAMRSGFITAWPCGARPTTATVNYQVDVASSNGAQVALSSTGKLCIYTLSAAHVIIDVNGWWT